MKKGSVRRTCHYCGRTIFWFVPTGKKDLFGMPELEMVKEYPFTARGMYYQCIDCFEKSKKGESGK